jgi:hypothetical protein
VGSVPPAVLGGERIPVQPRFVGSAALLLKELFPLLGWNSVVLPVGSRVLAPIVKKLRMLLFKWPNLRLNELVDFLDEWLKLLGDVAFHTT